MKALRVILFAVLMLTTERVWPAAMTTLTNFNAVYFLVDPNPAAIPTNVVLLTGNLTNWQKLTTNIVGALTINPTDLYVPYRTSATAFSDSYLIRLANEMYSTNSALRVARTGTFNDDGLAAQTFSVWGAGKNTGWQSVDDHAYLENNIQAIIGTSDPFNSHSLTLYNQALSDPSIASEAENSLSLDWIGSAWSTNQALSHVVAFSAWAEGNAAADEPTGTWVLESQIGGGSITRNMTVLSSGRTSVGQIASTNGYLQSFKPSFSTNYSIGTSTNQQFFLLNGTNQLITLPGVAGVRGTIYRFSMTNGYGSFILTNAADSSTIRDGTSSSYTNIGINEVGFLSDGSNWWLASKGKQIFPAASWSLNATISPVQDVITNLPWDTLEFNNSQGIALKTNALFAKPTQLWITNSGTYMITFSAVLKGSAGGSKLSIWLRKNGSDVARTRTDQGFSGSTAQQCMTVNYFVAVGAPCFYELVAASHDATPPTIEYGAANPTGYTAPAMPAIILTINRVSDTWP